MIKIVPPRFAGPYDLISIYDDAIAPPVKPERVDGESDDAFAARCRDAADTYDRRLLAARQTADWTGILIAGREPTRWRVRMIPGPRFLAWERHTADLSDVERCALLLRMAIVDVANWIPGFKIGAPVEHTDDRGAPTGLGPMAPASVIDSIFAACEGDAARLLLIDLGTQILHHRRHYSGN